MVRRCCSCLLLFLLMTSGLESAVQSDVFGNQFIGFSRFADFTKSKGDQKDELVLTSPTIRTALTWTELIASWNVELPPAGALKMEVRAIYPDHTTKYFVMGLWSLDPAKHPRESVLEQKDADGNVHTDTLRLTQPTQDFQLRATLVGNKSGVRLKFISVTLS